MMKKRGFTMLEILTVIGIMAILATLSAPSFQNWRQTEQFYQQVDKVFTLIDMAKGSSTTNKKCSNGESSGRWIVELDLKNSPRKFRLICDYGTGQVQEEPIDTGDTDFMFSEKLMVPWIFRIEEDGRTKVESNEGVFSLEFLNQPETMMINNELGDDFTIKRVRMNFQYAPDVSVQKTICFGRQEMYAYISLEGDVCLEYPIISTDCGTGAAVGTSCGGGIYAGNRIIVRPNDSGSMQWSTSKTYCENLTAQGYTDWYLPDLTVLADLYDEQVGVGGFYGRPWPYWSSVEVDASKANTLNFQNGNVSDPSKNASKQVRCVRNDV